MPELPPPRRGKPARTLRRRDYDPVGYWAAQGRKSESDPYHLYRIYDINDYLIYIGVSKYPDERMEAHRDGASSWAKYAVRAAVTVEAYEYRLALRLEREAIIAEKPLFNGTHSVLDERTVHRAYVYLIGADVSAYDPCSILSHIALPDESWRDWPVFHPHLPVLGTVDLPMPPLVEWIEPITRTVACNGLVPPSTNVIPLRRRPRNETAR